MKKVSQDQLQVVIDSYTDGQPLEKYDFSGLNFTFNLFLLIPEISVSIRRLHDTNKSGLWYLLTFTIIGIIPLIYFYSLKGDETKNNYNY